jgi:glycosyltransferase involved in cell wall biosynthesis
LRFFLYSFFVTKWFSIIFYTCIKSQQFDIIHARSYWPTISVLKHNIPIIFDLRSLWLLENLSTGDICLNSKSYYYWKQIEIDCLSNSYASTCVSSAMIDYINNIVPNTKTELIPISVSEKNFTFNKFNRVKNRNFLNWNENVIFVYSGSFGQSGININAITNLFKIIINTNDNFRILIITSEKNEYINKIMYDQCVDSKKFTIIHPKLNNISSWLDCSDIGIHALPIQLDFSTRLGTKVVEYWVNGLPVIVNQNVGAAADYIKKYKIGYVYNDISDNNNLENIISELLTYDRMNISNFAKENFSVKIISLKYLKIYQDSIKYQ